MTVRGYRDLEVWQKAMQLVTDVYALTKAFPKDELYALTNQLRRAAISVPSNIAEGRSRRSTRDFMRYASIAYGSLAEVETQLQISANLGYATETELKPLYDQTSAVSRMLNGLIKGLEEKLIPSSSPNAEC